MYSFIHVIRDETKNEIYINEDWVHFYIHRHKNYKYKMTKPTDDQIAQARLELGNFNLRSLQSKASYYSSKTSSSGGSKSTSKSSGSSSKSSKSSSKSSSSSSSSKSDRASKNAAVVKAASMGQSQVN